jgi:hypothetical protein
LSGRRGEEQFLSQIDNLVARPEDLCRWVAATPYGSTKRELELEIARLERETSDAALESIQQRVWQLALEAKIDAEDMARQLQRIKDEFRNSTRAGGGISPATHCPDDGATNVGTRTGVAQELLVIIR